MINNYLYQKVAVVYIYHSKREDIKPKQSSYFEYESC